MSKTASLPSEITAALPLGYTIRELQKTDKAEVLEVLTVLTTVGDITNAAWDERFEYISKHDDTYTILCIIDDEGKVCATGSLIIERKLLVSILVSVEVWWNSSAIANNGLGLNSGVSSIRNCGLVGHIEDIAVAKDQQGKKLGLRMINALDHIAEKAGCYKSILDCSENNRGFYEKCGFKFAGVEMAHYYNK
ncbi:Glucosamine-phosphate N-acetyltransferase-like protein [Orbilia oligospora]|uniref:Glucosamine 6-phosphate N-acetyltransferase n=1 Tax=Orbilia oligospora TaxID=2813651 RepID=A0A7C8NMZ1_ORBOL|nr:Glucosamine-phosphate N-acetyltransferase-like protein, variant 2 [Orbilia oligospora]KAF3118543.1 Glucosamine-phosphate N-acetyltransferase-like protein [Orbilia oligospora]KAF3121529.1 Glucosamine-phosphate N-acetyltransferase-like protein [Orbilia oligospora]KAF3124952.1 Glucosamine-phosphate N-acetyltransferase-like protein [Orbilia oligospora]